MGLNELATRIRRRETPFFDRLYRLLKSARSANVPVIRPLHRFLYAERLFRLGAWHWLVQNFYYIPLFKSQCRSYGRDLKLVAGIPQLVGDAHIHIGDNCLLHGTTTIVGAKVFDAPTLTIGDNTHLGYNLHITVGCDITIGRDVMIAGGVSIFSYDGHSSNPTERHGVAPRETGKPIMIEDNVWIGTRSIIMKGVTIGKNSIIAPNCVVTQKVPADSLVIGNPARAFPLIY